MYLVSDVTKGCRGGVQESTVPVRQVLSGNTGEGVDAGLLGVGSYQGCVRTAVVWVLLVARIEALVLGIDPGGTALKKVEI